MTTYTWSGRADGTSFEDSGNWSPGGGPPGADDIAQITSAPVVTGSGDVAELDLLNSAGTIVLDAILTAGSVYVGGATEIDGSFTCTATFEIFGSLDVNAGHLDVTGEPSANDGVYQYGADATIENGGKVTADWYIVGYYSGVDVALDVTGAGSLLSVPNTAVDVGGGVQGGLSLNTPGASVNVNNGGSIDTTVVVMGAAGDKLVVDDASVTVTQTSTDPSGGVAGVYLAGGTLAVQDGATFSTTFLLESGDTASRLVVDAATLDSTTAGPDEYNGLRLVDGATSFQDGASIDVTELYFGENGDGSTPTLNVVDSTLTATSTDSNGGFSFDGVWLAGGSTAISGSEVTAHALQVDSPPDDTDAPAATAMIENGSTVSITADVRLGVSDGAGVEVTVTGEPADGARSLLVFGGTLYVADGPGDGGGAAAALDVLDGALAAAAEGSAPEGALVVGRSEGDVGAVVVSGVAAAGDESLLSVYGAVIGELGTGEVQVAQGGSFSVGGTLTLGDLGGDGTLTLSDTEAGGEATADELVVGNLGTGDVALTEAGAESGGTLIVTGDATLGMEAGSHGAVSGTKGDWSVGGTLTVGAAGEADVGLDGGSLTVAGGLVVGRDAIEGLAADTYGASVVLGDVTLTLGGSLTVGQSGDASLILGSTEADVTVVSDVTIAEEDGSNSALTVENATTGLQVDTLVVGGAGQGSLDVLDGATVVVTGDAAVGLLAGTDAASVLTVTVGDDPLTGDAFTEGGAELNVEGQLTVGAAGDGTLSLGDDKGGAGSAAVGGDLVIGNDAGGVGAVLVQNTYTDAEGKKFTSELTVGGDIYVGGDATGGALDPGGTLFVSNGASVSAKAAKSGIVDVAQGAGSTGLVAVQDEGFLSVNEIDVGDAGKGTLSSDSGDVSVDGDLNIGVEKTGLGAAQVDGADSLLSFSGAIAVGLAGTGTLAAGVLTPGGVLEVTDGGQVQSEGMADGGVDVAVDMGSTGSVDVDAGTMLVNGVTIGAAGAGTLGIENAGQVESANAFDVGETMGASGTVTVTSGTVVADGLAVGVAGAGVFTLDAGKVDVTTGLDVGSDKTAVGTLAVMGGALTSDDLAVGAAGTGTLKVLTGGQALIEGTDTSDVVLGMDMGATGTGTVDGKGSSLTIEGGLTVGAEGTGTLTLSDQATAGPADGGMLDLEIGQAEGGTGAVTVESAAVLTTQDVVVGDSGTGTLAILNGGTVATAGDAVIGQSETGSGSVAVTGIGMADMGQSLWSLGGDLTIGDLGTGNFAVTDGAVEAVAGDLDLGGQTGVTGTTGKGTLSVSGLYTTLEAKAGFTVGDSGEGEVDVSGGGLVHADADVTLGSEVNSTGKLTVSFATFLQDGDKAGATFGEQGAATVTVNQGGFLSAGSIAVTLGAQSLGTGALVLNADTIGNVATVDTGDLTIGDFGAGTVTVSGGGTLATAGDAVLADTKGGSGDVLLTGRNADPMKGGGSSWTVGGAVDVGGSGDPGTGMAGGTGKITVADGAAAHFMGGLVLWAGSSVVDAAASPGLIEVGGTTAADTLTGVLVDSGGTIQGAGSIQAAVQDDGEVVAAGGTLAISGDVTGGGTLTLDTGSTLSLGGAVAATDTINLAGDPTLVLGDARAMLGTIEGFGAGDMLDLTGVAYAGTKLGYSGGVLTVVSGGTQATLSFSGSLGLGNFQLGKDSAGKAEISYVVCFAEGTRIAAASGRKVAVEALRPGRRVATADGGVGTVRWVGRRRIDLARHPDPAAAAPVRIRAGAVASRVPVRDLLVSPDHAVRVEGALIPARLLLNGASITQERARTSIVYYHVELERHDLLLAEGLPAESYLDTGNRGWFEGGPAPLTLHPDFAPVSGRPGACAELTLAEADVLPIWRRLARRAGAADMADEDEAPEPTLLLGGRVLSPVWRRPGACAFALPRAAGPLRLRSAASRPSDRRPWLDDRRRLGLRVTGIRLTGAAETREVALDNPALSSGWHDVERAGGRMWRWTDGDAALPAACAGPGLLELRWIEPGAHAAAKDRRAA